MSRPLQLGVFAVALFLVAAGAVYLAIFRNCCGARVEANWVEALLARRLRSFSMPAGARQLKNPYASSPQLLTQAARHFADHCASCHANDGSGNTELGRNLYPRTPDMRSADTQGLSDGELYYIIHNGVRWTGMPAWGAPGDDDDSWKLVLFIRHLPALTEAEMQDMVHFNPRSPADIEEEKSEQEFLQGEPEHKH